MAAAAAGAAQEKQFPPALLSFFIYNPRFGPREGEVRGAGLRAGVTRRPRGGPGAGAGGAGRAAGVGPRELQGASRRRPWPARRRAAPVTVSSSGVILQRLLSARCVPGPVIRLGPESSGCVCSGPGSMPVY